MVTVATLKEQLILNHNKMLSELEDTYMTYINNLLQQKKAIILKMQNVLHQQIQCIDNLSQETIINTYFNDNNNYINNKHINQLIDELSSSTSDISSHGESSQSVLFELTKDNNDNNGGNKSEKKIKESSQKNQSEYFHQPNKTHKYSHNTSNKVIFSSMQSMVDYNSIKVLPLQNISSSSIVSNGVSNVVDVVNVHYDHSKMKQETNMTMINVNNEENRDQCITFRQQNNLTVHTELQNDNQVQYHSHQRPYKCNYCTKAFKQKSNLQQHIRIHTGERPFKCNICNKLFTRKSSLNRHIRIHTGDLPYECIKCKKRFNERSNCNKHTQKCKG